MSLEHHNPTSLVTPRAYTHVVSGRGDRLVFIAGQVGLDADGHIVGGGDVGAQADRAFLNLQTCLDAVGASFADVAKLTTYTVGLTPEHGPILAAVRRRYLPEGAEPAVTGLGVAALARPELLFEVDAIAVLP